MPGPIERATNDAIEAGVDTSMAQRIGGTVATVTGTGAGAVGTTLLQNGGFAALSSVTTGSPEVAGLSWIATFAFEGAKKSRFINQDRDQWWLLPALGLIIGVIVWSLVSDGQYAHAVSKAIQNCGLMGINAATNFKTIKPLLIMGSKE